VFKNILLAVHGEEINIEQVMDQTLMLAQRNNCQLNLLHVREDNLLFYGEVDSLLPAVAREQFIDYIHNMNDTQARKVLTDFEEKAADSGIKFNWKTRSGKPAEQIVEELRTGHYDLLVLGTKAPGPGNTSSRVKERVAKEHLCTVLMVK
jgi:nucleotide-binding universal stress UspA family protein